MAARWTDLVDPTREEVLGVLPAHADPDVVEALVAHAREGGEPRPVLESHGAYVFGILIAAHPLPDEDRVLYQEVDLVATPELLVTVRKSVPTAGPFEPPSLQPSSDLEVPVGKLVHRLFDVDGRVEVGDHALFPGDVERLFAETSETLVRVTEELDIARDLLAGVRDHHQSKIAETQGDVVKKLTVIASLVLVPSLIVGFYGQNFGEVFDSGYWRLGVSVGLILASTVAQLVLYRWRRWI